MKLYFNQFIKNTYLAESTDEMMSYLLAVLENIQITCQTCIFNDPVLKDICNNGNIFTNLYHRSMIDIFITFRGF